METVRQHVALTDLRFFAYHGYYPEEQVLGNEFKVSIRVGFETSEMDEDELDGTVNYVALYEIVKVEMESPRKLLEAVAKTILNRIRQAFPALDEIEVTICKNQPPFGADQAKAVVTLLWKV